MAEAEQKKKVKISTAIKRCKQNSKKNLINKSFKSKAKTAIKQYNEAIKAKEDSKVVEKKLSEVCSLMDKGVKRGVYKQNKADRLKSRFTINAK